ncbi:hypothetical protein NQ314_011913 [Rhamnusium bicolor]|uniref:BRWD/PHIP N-terminal domain-containing protein n=1 Tax=Rhamnusium bicolor TaxID=1586634 RepID=A0AAV8XEL2_9CUCU|nr:hypothetical protein NQ314_011913 [Rhamnusium bicolor]
MENDKSIALTADVYFLIQRFLSAGLLKKTLKIFNKELEENNILPRRIDWEGNQHERTVEDMIKQFPNIRPDYLLQLCYQATNTSGTTLSNNKSLTSFLSFRSNIHDKNKILTNFRQYFNFVSRQHGAPIQELTASCNILNSIRGREVSGPLSRHRAISPRLYSSIQIQRITIGHLSAVYCLLFDHSGKYIITGADDLLIKLWSAHTGRLLAAFRGAKSEITDIAINSENTLLAAGSIDRILRVWNIQNGAPVAVLTGHTGMVTSVNFCPTPSWGVRNTPILYQERIRPGQAQMICSSFSPGGTFLATGSADHHIRVYYMKGDEGPHRILEMEAHSDRVDSIQWAHSGLKFLSGSKDGMAIIWWFERQQWKSIHLDMTTKLSSSSSAAETDTKKLKVTMVCWNKFDNWVVTAVSDYTLKIWTIMGNLEKVLPGHTDEIYVLEAHPHDNNIILSAGHDGQLFIWDILKGEIVFRFLNTIEGQGYGAIFDVKWSPDGCVIAASDSHGHILTFGFGNGSPYFEQLPKELFFHTDYRPLVRDSNDYVLDEQTQIPPHLMPPPFLVDIDGNPYPPMLQRLVPGRELCNVEQLVPNIVIGNEGTQEVIQDIPQNLPLVMEDNQDEDIRVAGSSFRQSRRNRDIERIRQSTGKRKVMHKAEHPEMEGALYTWFLKQRGNYVPISSKRTISQQALAGWTNLSHDMGFTMPGNHHGKNICNSWFQLWPSVPEDEDVEESISLAEVKIKLRSRLDADLNEIKESLLVIDPANNLTNEQIVEETLNRNHEDDEDESECVEEENIPRIEHAAAIKAFKVEAMKDMESEEYQKQLRQRPHMISINTSNNIKRKEEKKKKNAKYVTRSTKTQYEYRDEDHTESSGNDYSESSGYSDWMAEEGLEPPSEPPKRSKRRQVVQNHVRLSEQDDEDEEDDDEDEEEEEEPRSSRENHVSRSSKENNAGKTIKENHVNKSRENGISKEKSK